jgi:hypothetical protein
MTVGNMDNTLRGWAKLDSAASESTIQSNVTWGIENYTDATARQYLIDTYHWTINGGVFDGSKTIKGDNTANTLTTTKTKTTLHGLGGDDTLTGGTTDDILVGGAGNDTLKGAGGRDVFDYGFKNAGNDTTRNIPTANVLVKGMCIVKHIRHSTHLANIPTVNILIKGVCVIKHPRHISHIANIPTTNVLIKGICIRKCSVGIACMRHILRLETFLIVQMC